MWRHCCCVRSAAASRRGGGVSVVKDFDAWAYNLTWPQCPRALPLHDVVNVVAEDCKFAYNAWSVLRLAAFFGTRHPRVLSGLTATTPSMDIARGGNRIFYMHSHVDAHLARGQPHVALTPCDDDAVTLHDADWRALLPLREAATAAAPVSVVVGMENGMSAAVRAQCTHAVYIPQYGSIGSLSMTAALAIALHKVWCVWHNSDAQLCHTRCLGHMPLSSGSPDNANDAITTTQSPRPPHERDLLGCSTSELRNLLQQRRMHYALQLAVVVYNALGDRNIGAILRNANAFNCAAVHIVGRRRYNRRGALGTDKLVDMHYHTHNDDAATRAALLRALDGYVVWLLYPYYPYLRVYDSDTSATTHSDDSATYLRPHDARLCAWASTRHALTHAHSLARACAHLVGRDVYLDDAAQMQAAVAQVRTRGQRGIALVVCEEGSTPHPLLASIAERVVYTVHPSRLAHDVQRGLNGGLASAIALHRLRTAIDAL